MISGIVEHLFVYGLLRGDIGGPMQPALEAAARFVGQARWRGRLFLVGEYPGAVPSESVDEVVVGELYELENEAGALLARLDAYEGVPQHYLRVRSTVETGGVAVEAWVYVWNRPTEGLGRIESGDFAEVHPST